jgi:hypothetical protein
MNGVLLVTKENSDVMAMLFPNEPSGPNGFRPGWSIRMPSHWTGQGFIAAYIYCATQLSIEQQGRE